MSELYIKTEYDTAGTVMRDCAFTAPYKVAKPFSCGGGIKIMVMMASAGMLDGDRYNIKYDIGAKSTVRITGQSYTKLFKCERDLIRQNSEIHVGESAALCYAPCPIIPFGGSVYESKTNIYLEKSSRLVLCDILSCGRTAMGERLKFSSYKSKTRVYVDNRLVFADFTRLIPSEYDLSGVGFFEGFTHTGLIYIYGAELDRLPRIEDGEAAVTAAQKGICVRAAANSADDIVNFFEEINRTIK